MESIKETAEGEDDGENPTTTETGAEGTNDDLNDTRTT
jgi:hypothetical protein